MSYAIRTESGLLIGKLSNVMTNHYLGLLEGEWRPYNIKGDDTINRCFEVTESCYIGSIEYGFQIYVKAGSIVVKNTS